MRSFTRTGLGGALAAGLVFAAPGLVICPARAQQPATPAIAPEGPMISLVLRDAPLQQAVAALTRQTNLGNIVIQNVPGKEFGKVNVQLTEKPFAVVLKAVCDSAGATLTERDGIYYLKPRTAQDDVPQVIAPAPATQAATNGQNGQAVPVAQTVARAPRKVGQLAKVQLSFIQPSIFIKMLNDEKFLEAVMNHNMNAVQFPKPEIITNPLINFANDGAASNLRPTLPTAPQSGVGGTSAGREAGDSAGARGGGQGFPGGGGGAGRGGFGGGQGFGGGGQGGPGGAGGQQGQQGQGALRPPGITNLISNDADNALLVEYDDVDDLNRLREIVRLLDVKPKQVQVRAEFVRVSISDADSFGIDWRINPIGNLEGFIPGESGGAGSPTLLLAYATGNAVANLRAALIRETGNVLQAPIISTINNVPATINISDTITIPQSVVVSSPAGVTTANSFAVFTTFNGLNVLPHINGDNSITMTLSPQLQTLDPQPGGGVRSNTQFLTTTRIVQNGETMVLGGFISKQEVRSERRVPFLSELPLIGLLFRQNSRTVNGFEVLVFVTPTIIEDRSQGTTGTGGVAPAPTP